MSDRELLEWAAKAAGYKHTQWARYSSLVDWGVCTIDGIWNPLTDDGDALRLAVKLGMNFHTGYRHVSAEILSDSDEPSILITMRHTDGDEFAATRRVIVGAAAEIGRTM